MVESIMIIFMVGAGVVLVGVLLNIVGWTLHRQTVGETPPGFFEWLLEEIKRWYPLLTGRDSTTGERIAAFGAILIAVGLVTLVTGLVVWAAA
jgi:hypothetical protein